MTGRRRRHQNAGVSGKSTVPLRNQAEIGGVVETRSRTCRGRNSATSLLHGRRATKCAHQTPVADAHGYQWNENGYRCPDDGVRGLESGIAEQKPGKLLVIEAAAVGVHQDGEAELTAGKGLRLVVPETW